MCIDFLWKYDDNTNSVRHETPNEVARPDISIFTFFRRLLATYVLCLCCGEYVIEYIPYLVDFAIAITTYGPHVLFRIICQRWYYLTLSIYVYRIKEPVRFPYCFHDAKFKSINFSCDTIRWQTSKKHRGVRSLVNQPSFPLKSHWIPYESPQNLKSLESFHPFFWEGLSWLAHVVFLHIPIGSSQSYPSKCLES